MKVYAFSHLNNAIKDNTSFRESVASLVSMSDEVHVFIGKSIDGTSNAFEESEKLKIHHFENSESLNILQTLREECENIPDAWAIYLEPDEVLHSEDVELLREDLKRASELHCEAISFRNLNFTKDPHHIDVSRNAVAHSVRLFRLGSNDFYQSEEKPVEAKVYYSEVKIFNYLNLRKEKEGIETVTSKKILRYLGSHPPIMKRRVENWNGIWNWIDTAKVYILGERRDFEDEFIKKIKAKKIIWAGSIVDIPPEDRPRAIILKPTPFQKIFRRSAVPKKMGASKAHNWSLEFILILKLSEKGIGIS
ncbi:MAG: hypothetical protein ACJAT2_001054 [Bacteriovoracaceae bacterium]|jgi:hypothetical protein